MKIRRKKKIFYLCIGIICVLFISLIIASIYSHTEKSKDKKIISTLSSDIIPLSTLYSSDDSETFDVCIDPGHGGNDNGCNKGKLLEKDDNLKLALVLYKYLSDKGVSVAITRATDTYLSLEERKELAEKSKCKLFISLHRNFYENDSSINGAEAWIHSSNPSNVYELANTILNSLCNDESFSNGTFNNRGVKTGTMTDSNDNYAINKVSMSSMILEMGFMSNKEDNIYFKDNTDTYATIIGDKIIEYINSY